MTLIDSVANSDAADGTPPTVPGVMVGRVIDTFDPLMLGRVRVQLPVVDGLDLSPWARVAAPAASMASGFYWIPNMQDEVLVAFEQGDLHAPYIIGCLWSAVMVPPSPSPSVPPFVRMLRTPTGNQIIFTEAPPSVTITTSTMLQSITMTPAGIQIVAGANVINMTPDGITITGTPNLNLVASAQITITAPSVSVVGAATTSIGSPASPCAINGLPVKIN